MKGREEDSPLLSPIQGNIRCEGCYFFGQGLDRFEEVDLIYSAGLYDYLEDRAAAKLTRRLFERLAHGGRLLLTNFLTSNAWCHRPCARMSIPTAESCRCSNPRS